MNGSSRRILDSSNSTSYDHLAIESIHGKSENGHKAANGTAAIHRATPLSASTHDDIQRSNVKDIADANTTWNGLATPAGSTGTESQRRRSEPLLDMHGLHLHLDMNLRWRERVKHFTWTWFTMTMATGQIASVLYQTPYRFNGLFTIGCVFFILNIVLFIFNVVMITLRFTLYPHTFSASIRHPTESLFVAAPVISIGTILTNISEYGNHYGKTGPWLMDVMVVLFWIYCGLALTFTCSIYLTLWSTQTFTISEMTPVWIFPTYPLLVIGPHAGTISSNIEGTRALDVIVGGFAFQGIGFMLSFMVYSAFLYRLMTQKLPKESLRPGMFISVGPSGFTASGLINMASNLPTVIPHDFMNVGQMAGTISIVMANWVGIWLWALATFLCIVSVGAHVSCIGNGRFHFAMTWFSFVFPNTGYTSATFAVGKALGNKPIRVVGCVFVCLVIAIWLFVFTMMIRAVVTKQILWPQKQEDRDEGGWKSDTNTMRRPERPLSNEEVDAANQV